MAPAFYLGPPLRREPRAEAGLAGRPACRSVAGGGRPARRQFGVARAREAGRFGRRGRGIGDLGRMGGERVLGLGGLGKDERMTAGLFGFSSRRVLSSLLGIPNFSNWEPYRGSARDALSRRQLRFGRMDTEDLGYHRISYVNVNFYIFISEYSYFYFSPR